MTLSDIRTLLVSVDPNIKHYFSMGAGESYSYWEETNRLPFSADDRHEEGWHFYVHFFTKTECDPVADSFFNTLDEDPRTTVRWTVGDREEDTGYIHHIYECEGY